MLQFCLEYPAHQSFTQGPAAKLHSLTDSPEAVINGEEACALLVHKGRPEITPAKWLLFTAPTPISIGHTRAGCIAEAF